MREPDLVAERRNWLGRRILAGFWIVWAVWLIARPAGSGETSLSPDARRQLAVFGFALVFLVSYGLLRPWRWPVTASRALVAALVAAAAIGPAGRDVWVFAIDVVFAAAGIGPAFFVIRLGTAPPPKRSSEMLRRRIERRSEHLRKRR